ncbi:MAG: phosphoglucomutase [Clostridiales bacterium]|nr:MAG: phosphoglucomutase [Clostridiales bacterium]
MSVDKNFEFELNSTLFDEEYKKEMRSLSEQEKTDAYFKKISFGTAGIRGKMGVGTNRINKFLIMRISYAYAKYLTELSAKPKCVIAYDSRNRSREYAKITAITLASSGVKAYLFDDYSSTPELSFAVRELETTGGVVITASHNPPEYNGYKVYSSSGRQVLEDEASKITKYFNETSELSSIDLKNEDALEREGLLNYIGKDILDKYDEAIMSYLHREHDGKDIKVVYSPLHGVGARGVLTVFSNMGLESVFPVLSQLEPDGSFPEAKEPNPENESVFEKAKEIGIKNKADILIATDPDADRVACMVMKDGTYQMISGNEMALIILDYYTKRFGVNSGNIITSIVSTQAVDDIAEKNGLNVIRGLTGFKYIGEAMNHMKKKDFVLGFEESYGYLSGFHARDKDAIITSGLIVEIARFYLKENKTLLDAVDDVYNKYGYWEEGQLVKKLEGAEGKKKIDSIIKNFRENPLLVLAGKRLVKTIDYLNDETGLPKSNVLKYIYEDGSWIAIRPSGTEPKLKIYIGVKGRNRKDVETKYEELVKTIEEIWN